jgi:hypothetical protein
VYRVALIICKSQIGQIDGNPLIRGGGIRKATEVRRRPTGNISPPPKGDIPIGAHIDFGVAIPVVHEGKRQIDGACIVIITEAREKLPRGRNIYPVVRRGRIGNIGLGRVPAITASIPTGRSWRLS